MSWISGQSFPFVNTQVYEYKHAKNGLRVLLCPVPESNVCAYMRAINAGSKEEASCVPMGAAHFIEHMSFRIQNGKIWSLASKGDVINAETNMDSTRFYVVHLPEQTEQTIEIDANRFRENAVPADKVSIERHAVLNELERGKRASNKMFRMISSVAILQHPYHHSTIGTETDVQQTTAADMEHFRNKYYVPNNTTLIFAGSFNPTKILEHVDTHFGDLVAGEHCNPVHTPEPLQNGKKTVEMNIDAPCPMICMAFHQPKGSSKESLVLKCISQLVWSNKQGRAKNLISSGTLHDISTYSPRQLDPYLWFFHGTFEESSKDNRENIEKQMLHVLESFISQKVSPSVLNNIKTSMKDEWHRSWESVTDMMNELGRGVSMGNWKDFTDREKTLDQITSQDIQRVAKLIFHEKNMTVTHVIPTKTTLNKISATEMSLNSGTTSPNASEIIMPENIQKGWQLNSISPLTNILHVPRASYVRVTLSARFSPAEHDIATILTSSMGKGVGTNGKTATTALMEMHTERSFSHDHEFVHMAMEMPSSSNILKKASDLMFHREWLNPSFERNVIELQKKRHIAEMNALKNDQGYQTKKYFIQSLFQKTLYHIPMDVRIQRIKNISKHDVENFHSTWLKGTNPVYVTMVTPNTETAATLGEIFPAHETVPNQTLEWTASSRKETSKTVKLSGFGSFQIMMGQTVKTVPNTKEFIALQCAINILGGGMTGRLMHTVREQKGLGTYGLYAVLQTVSPKTPSIFCVQGTFSPTSIQEGMACTKELVNEWAAHGVSPLELNTAKERLIGSKLIASDTIDNLYSMVLKNILTNKDSKIQFQFFKDTILSLTPKYVNDTIQKYIDINCLSSVIVGP
jgi:zinc protease